MKKKNMFSTTMAAVVALVMIYTVTGCGAKDVQTAVQSASTSLTKETQVTEKTKATKTPIATPGAASSKKTDQKKKTDSFLLYVISKDGVNIRQEPSVSSASMGMGDYGDSYTCNGSVMGSDGSSWYQISYQGKAGYVSTAYASKTAPSGSSTDSSSSTNTSGTTQSKSSGSVSGSGNTAGNSQINDSDEDGEASLNLKTIYLVASDGSTVAVKEQTNGDYAYRDENGVGFTAIDEDSLWQDQYGNTYSVLEDDTHRFGYELEQHTLTAADGSTVTITEKADGPYQYRDDNGVGYIDEGDGVWLDQYNNIYTEK